MNIIVLLFVDKITDFHTKNIILSQLQKARPNSTDVSEAASRGRRRDREGEGETEREKEGEKEREKSPADTILSRGL